MRIGRFRTASVAGCVAMIAYVAVSLIVPSSGTAGSGPRSAAAGTLATSPAAAAGRTVVSARDRYFLSSDGVRLHLIEAGAASERTILFIPGWTMPAWIWTAQIRAFSPNYHVVAFDPRGQGGSDIPATGYEPSRRGQDIAEAIAATGPNPVVIIAWSLGVLDTLAYLHAHGDAQVAGLVLVDNSVGEEPPPAPIPPPRHRPRPLPRAEAVRTFVRGMFIQPQTEAFLDRLTEASLQTPDSAGDALRAYRYPRSFWRDAVYAAGCPVLYVVRPRWAAQAANLVRNKPGTESALFMNAGHALFVDEAGRFNTLLADFIRRRVWP